MAGCNCKGNNGIDLVQEKEKAPLGKRIMNYSLKSLAFLFMVALLPIINLFIIWFIFKTLVLSENVDIKPLLLSLGNKFKPKDDDYEDDEEDDYDNLTEEDVEMVGVDVITNKSK